MSDNRQILYFIIVSHSKYSFKLWYLHNLHYKTFFILIQSDPHLTAPYIPAPPFTGTIFFPRKFWQNIRKFRSFGNVTWWVFSGSSTVTWEVTWLLCTMECHVTDCLTRWILSDSRSRDFLPRPPRYPVHEVWVLTYSLRVREILLIICLSL